MKTLRSSGFSLMEVMIALGVLSIGGYFMMGLLKTSSQGQKVLLAQDDARVLTDNMAALLSNPKACTNTFGSGQVADGGTGAPPVRANPVDGTAPDGGTVIAEIRDGSSPYSVLYEVSKKYGNRGVVLNGITIGGGTPPGVKDSKTQQQKWQPSSTPNSGTAFVQLDWIQSGTASNNTGPQHLYRYFMVYVTNIDGSNRIVNCTAQLGGAAGIGSGTTGYIPLWETDKTIGDSKLYQDSGNGNIGIGHTNPQASLDIKPPMGGTGLIINTTSAAPNSAPYAIRLLNNLAGGSGAGLYEDYDGNLRVENNGNLYGFTITPSGKVGIGTIASSARMEVVSTVASTVGLKVTAGSGAGAHGIVGQGCAGSPNCYGVVGVAGDNGIASGVIGQSADDGIYGILGYKRTHSFWGNSEAYLGAGTWSGSDFRLKKNIEPITSSLDRLMQLKPVRFDWKEESDAYRAGQRGSYGFIAQDLEKVFPEAVHEVEAPHRDEHLGKVSPSLNEKLGRFKVAEYVKLVAVVTAALQEVWETVKSFFARQEKLNSSVTAKISDQQKQIDELLRMNQESLKRIRELETQVNQLREAR